MSSVVAKLNGPEALKEKDKRNGNASYVGRVSGARKPGAIMRGVTSI
jgi:hypothetical protein